MIREQCKGAKHGELWKYENFKDQIQIQTGLAIENSRTSNLCLTCTNIFIFLILGIDSQ